MSIQTMNLLRQSLSKVLTYTSVCSRYKYHILVFFVVFTVLLTWTISKDAETKYESLLSATVYDRNGTPLNITGNAKGHYVSQLNALPNDFKDLLIQKEDQFFYYHLGINPVSTIRAFLSYLTDGTAGGGSTITQQLSKNLLGTELERNIPNKLREALYSVSIEFFNTKDEILTMYGNTVYLGNQVQGFETGSKAYFGKSLIETTHSERISLLATLSYPNARNPWEERNAKIAENLSKEISPAETFIPPLTTKKYSLKADSFFELASAGVTCKETCHTTIDDSLTTTVREILRRHIRTEWDRGARNGAVVVIDPRNSEVLAMVGSKDPDSTAGGDQINMALEPRPIGSTVKPLIYLKGFMEGLRPYTLVEDREYKYSIATGFPLYPKNYDGQYHGEVTLHEALSNSLNVPSVKVLEYIGLENFYAFLSGSLSFSPIQEYDSYQYGIALGGLEMDLMTLTHYFTLFPRGGTLEPLRILKNSTENFSLPPQSDIQKEKRVADEKFTQLVHTIISDRLTGVSQFGLESTLNIETTGYGVKTGTSRDFHDSWVVGYTPDLVVGVWIGNTENEPLDQVSGQSGAGAVWHDVMNFLLTTPYHTDTHVMLNQVARFPIENSDEWGLPDDTVAEHRDLLTSDTLVLSPYNNDSFEFFSGITIPLIARVEAEWSVNGEYISTGKQVGFKPLHSGTYEIVAIDPETRSREILQVQITETE